MFRNVYSILVAFLGESKQGGYFSDVSQYQFNCPRCAEEYGDIDGKFNLEVNFELGKFHCWKCNEKGNISYLIKRWGKQFLYKKYIDEIKNIRESKFFDTSLFSDTGASITLTTNNLILELPKNFIRIEDISKCKNQRVKKYLIKRGITQDIIDTYNIGYTNYDENNKIASNRIIIPSYDEYGQLNYWVGRDFTDNDKRVKYYNSNSDKKEIVFCESVIDWDADIILVEGAIDSIYYPNAISMLGKVITTDCELFKKIYKKANATITICLDSDTDIKETKKIYKLLNTGRLRGKIKYIRMDKFKDFGELYEQCGKKGVIYAIRSEKKFSEIDLII